MNSQLYHEISGQFIPDITHIPEKDASLAQLEMSWKSHPFTAKLHKDLVEEMSNLLDSAIALSSNYHQHNNHQIIIDKLIRVDQLRKIKSRYA